MTKKELENNLHSIYKKFIFAEMQNIMKNKKMTAAEKFKRTISQDLFNSWGDNKRPGDVTRIKNITGRCYPVIQRALKYGYVMDSNLSDEINNYFLDRKGQEAAAAEKIKN